MRKMTFISIMVGITLAFGSWAMAQSRPALPAPTNLTCRVDTVAADVHCNWNNAVGAEKYSLKVELLISGTWKKGDIVQRSFETGNSYLDVPFVALAYHHVVPGPGRAKVEALNDRGKSKNNPFPEWSYFTLPPLAKTDKGVIQGLDQGVVSYFVGVPYAAAPTGALRFKPPHPQAAWEGTLSATAPGPVCPQGAATNEDCLYLNVTVPKPAKARMPVYVWIHGGGFTSGSGAANDATAIATTADAVVVTINYRLGILGFLANQALETVPGDSGNYGLQDQQAALRWVKHNIARFGGDPDRVTIGGQSAGSMSTCHHLNMPDSEGLFAQAIAQSGACAFNWISQQQKYDQTANVPTDLGCTGTPADIASCLRSPTLDITKVLSVQAATVSYLQSHGFSRGVFMPGVGGVVVPVQARFGLGKVPMIAGGTKEENGFWLPGTTNPTTAAGYLTELQKVYGNAVGTAVAAAYPFSNSITGWEQLVIAFTDYYPTSHFVSPDPDPQVLSVVSLCYDIRTLQLARETGAAPIYGYVFADPNAPYTRSVVPTVNGPFHTTELQYLFLTTPSLLQPPSKDLSNQMLAYWSNFINSGDPNGHRVPYWPAYRTSHDVMQLVPYAVHTFDADAVHKCTSFWQKLGDAL